MFVSCSRYRCFLVTCAALLCGEAQGRALDFQLHNYTVQEDGFTHQRTYMQNDAGSRVVISPPEGWNNVGSADALTMVPPSPTGSMARIEKSPFSPALAFKDKGLDSYRQRAISTVPQGATAVHIVSERDNAFPFFRWSGYAIVVEYQFYGQTMQRSLLFVNTDPKEQLLLTVVAPKEGFKAVDDAAQDVLRSWQVIPGNGV